ncbi:MAG: Ig-like domain-containing protein [Fimbriiglobus sp.]|nr:Ig-like domain-containing protein [Fimbriiglobus sp.]
MSDRRANGLRAGVERLEPRENPSDLTGENFDQLAAPALPGGWASWSNSGQIDFITSRLSAASLPNSLASLGNSATQSRIWTRATFSVDHGAAVSVRSNAAARLEVIARGTNLGAATPTYVAAVALPGGGAELVEVRAGVRTTLGRVAPAHSLPLQGVWLQVQVVTNAEVVAVRVRRADTGQFLTPAGGWQADPIDAARGTTSVRPTAGSLGVGRLSGGHGMAHLDDFVVLPPPTPATPPTTPNPNDLVESFDTTRPKPLPNGWQQWSNDGLPRAAVGTTRAFSPDSGLSLTGSSATATRAWFGTALSADVVAEASVFADTLIPAGVIVRGANLNSTTPSYYSLSVVRGLTVQLKAVVNGAETVLGSVKSAGWLSGQWVRLSLEVRGDQVRGRVYRTDTRQWLAADGSWVGRQDTAFTVNSTAVSGIGVVGVERARSSSGTVWFDDFSARSANSVAAPTVSVSASQPNPVSGVVRFTAAATPAERIARVEFRLNGVLRSTSSSATAQWELNTAGLPNGEHRLDVLALDVDGRTGTAALTLLVQNSDTDRPTEVRKYSHIRLAQLAYAGNPMGATELEIARKSLDLIIPNTRFLPSLEAVAPDTPKVIYSNISNLYGNLLTDWFDYAAANGVDRESAFFHVTQPTAFSGQSAASVPVRNFWAVQRGAANGIGTLTDFTRAASGTGATGTPFGTTGQALHLGWTDPFREINFTLQSPATGWAGNFEYVAEVNADGSPKVWKTLSLLGNTTRGFTTSGQLVFDPPADWLPAKLRGNGQLLYYMRVVTTQGTGPTARTLFGRDYVNANGRSEGTIPAFDEQADHNGDGYLTDAEWARRRQGFNARFEHESRLFFPYYGQMRFVTNPAGTAVKGWAADYHKEQLAENPLADGVFLDNSNGRLPFAGTPVKESVATFTTDLAAAVGAVTRALPGKWVVANTAGSITEGNAIAAESTAVLEEFLLRPNDHNWANLLDMQERINGRLAADAAHVIIDTHPGTGRLTSERTRMGALAYYYLLGDPDKTFLMFFGGSGPSSPWRDVFVPAATFDIGRPTGEMKIFSTGNDPQNPALTYRVYGREYANALTLFKPRSYTLGRGTGSVADATATTHHLNGRYRLLQSDGSLGGVVTSVTLRNGEGVVLVKA